MAAEESSSELNGHLWCHAEDLKNFDEKGTPSMIYGKLIYKLLYYVVGDMKLAYSLWIN